MTKLLFVLVLLGVMHSAPAQKSTAVDGDWSKQYVVLKNTAQADAMVRVGDIDNLNNGWAEGFNPFSGKSTDPHQYPWELNKGDARGTDLIMVPSGYKYESDAGHDGYTGSTERPGNKPVAILVPLREIKTITVTSAELQLFIDDFQSPEYGKKFQFRINGTRFIEAEKIITNINQAGPVGKLITLRFSAEQLNMLKADTLSIFIDDTATANGDGYAIDFVKLLINPKGALYKGNISGKILDRETRKPIVNASAEVKEFGLVKTNAEGEFLLKDIPAGLTVVTGSASGYSSGQQQTDVIATETTNDVLIELKRSGKVKYDDKALQEGDNVVMNNIQFEVNSATLLPAGKSELNKLAAFMKENGSVEIQLSGHTSSEGAATSNRELSLKRVMSCRDYLVSKGIDEGRIAIRGLGPDQPVASNDTEAGRAKNRRVEMKITKL